MSGDLDPSWLKAKIDQRLALLKDAIQLQQLAGIGIVMTSLTEPPEDASEEEYKAWDESCDNCGKVGGIYTGHATIDVGLVQVVITFGSCPECKDLP